jgi:hypothetical protein
VQVYVDDIVFGGSSNSPVSRFAEDMSREFEMSVGGYPKIRMRSPNTREITMNTFKYSDDARGDKESPKDCSHLKSCESFYTCPRAPFYRETKGLLHSENTPRTKGIFVM